MNATKHEYQQRLQDRDAELVRLRNQLLMKNKTGPNQTEMESRIHNLTNTVLQKQNELENLNANNQSLQLQLEKSQVRFECFFNIRI